MRISTAFQYSTYMNDIRTSQTRYYEAQRTVSTGKRLNSVSDDPMGSSTVLSLRSLKSHNEQYSKNLNTATGILGFSETALDESHTLLRRAYELAVSGANSSTDQTSRNAMADEITEMQRRLLELANTQGPNGQYIFAGQMTDTKPFSLTGTTVTYNGDTNNLTVETGPNDTMAVNTRGDQVFLNAYQQLEDLKTNLIGGDIPRLSGVNVPGLQDSMKQFNAARGVVGSKMRTVDQLRDHMTRRIDELTVGISDIEEVDMSEAILDYKLAETAYQAALSTVSQASRLSLLDFMR